MFAISLLAWTVTSKGLHAALAGCLLSSCLYYLYIRHLFSPFRSLPSPRQGLLFRIRLLHEPRLPEIEHWIDTVPNKGLIRYHGLFNRERVLITSPQAAKEFLNGAAYKFVKPKLQATLSELISGRGLLTLEGEEHKQVRKRLNPAFNQANLRAWFPCMWKTAVDALNTIPRHTEVEVDSDSDSNAAPKSPSNPTTASHHSGVTSIQIPIAAASIDMIGHFGYNVEFDTINTMASGRLGAAAKHLDAKDKRRRFGRAFIHLFKTTRHGQPTLELASIVGPGIALRAPLRAVRTIKSIMGLFYDVMRDIVEDHERTERQGDQEAQECVDVLTHAIRSRVLSHADLVEEGVHMMSGGTETSVGTATWAMHLLSRHPEVQTRLRDEIRANIPSPRDPTRTSTGTDAVTVTQASLRKLPYLNAVANEVLRHHSVNGLLWRECAEPATIANVPILRGATVVFSPWALNRDPKHWGPDARVFNPDRWVDNPSTGGADHPYSFLTFGGGPRRCIGEQYARDQLLSVICTYIGRYALSPVDPATGSDDGAEIGDNFALTLFKVLDGWKLRTRTIPGW
ncbi:Protein LUTEIN DEFICIENT 5, chloroplastic [Colletotrichum tanaceti]|uniref:Protein LUTEIN DEFICIENT 5, chloroplastic n=1 Tax=Colletotrichum tanaceti TaxID=1306861 RepID=A0A4U6XAE9_9PEZI|nr:Protein LUTEIN DEFICIENT 5, chloroplastic [Colletotrichum tanaceti]TKW52650.1 Protein LUTEIN DEFICIENT 5, chloroplastic [Colletotrichum tanaceti]